MYTLNNFDTTIYFLLGISLVFSFIFYSVQRVYNFDILLTRIVLEEVGYSYFIIPSEYSRILVFGGLGYVYPDRTVSIFFVGFIGRMFELILGVVTGDMVYWVHRGTFINSKATLFNIIGILAGCVIRCCVYKSRFDGFYDVPVIKIVLGVVLSTVNYNYIMVSYIRDDPSKVDILLLSLLTHFYIILTFFV